MRGRCSSIGKINSIERDKTMRLSVFLNDTDCYYTVEGEDAK